MYNLSGALHQKRQPTSRNSSTGLKKNNRARNPLYPTKLRAGSIARLRMMLQHPRFPHTLPKQRAPEGALIGELRIM